MVYFYTHFTSLICLPRKARLLQEITNESWKENRTIEKCFLQNCFHNIDSVSAWGKWFSKWICFGIKYMLIENQFILTFIKCLENINFKGWQITGLSGDISWFGSGWDFAQTGESHHLMLGDHGENDRKSDSPGYRGEKTGRDCNPYPLWYNMLTPNLPEDSWRGNRGHS